MRGNEMWEDIIIVLVLLFTVPIIAVMLLLFGAAVLYLSPIFILALIIWLAIRAKCKGGGGVTMGRIKLIRIPKSVTKVFKTIIKMVLGLLILATYLWIMIHIPMGWACIITFSICGYAAGKQLGKKGD